MRQSIFNSITPMPEGGFSLYNFFTGKCMYLNLFSRDYYENPNRYDPNHPSIRRMVQAGFLVEYDELRYLETLVRQSAGNNRSVTLVICPTVMCNFACPYCFETARLGRMSEETQKELVHFAEQLLDEVHPFELTISWYGGEPLLEKEIISHLSEQLIALCEARHIVYQANITTNGYFLTEDTNALCEQCRISQIQVTMDGPDAKTHDQTRCLKNGGGTFDRIVRNIQAFHGPADISIRCNVHKENRDQFPALKETMERMGKEKKRNITVYAGHMDGFKGYADKEIEQGQMLNLVPFSKKLPHYSFRGTVCMMHRAMQMAVDELGNLYKCYEHVGKDQYVIGNVKTFHLLKPGYGNAELLCKSFETVWPGDDQECMQCPVLPACLGGCPEHRLTRKKECLNVKFALDEYGIAICREMREHDK